MCFFAFCSHTASIDQESHCGVKEDRSEDKFFEVQSNDISAKSASSYHPDDRNTVEKDKPIQIFWAGQIRRRNVFYARVSSYKIVLEYITTFIIASWINQILEIKIIYEWYPFYEVFCSYFPINPERKYCETGCIHLRVPSMTPLAVDSSDEDYSCYNPDDTVEKQKPIAKIDQKGKKERRIKTVRGYKCYADIQFSHEGLKTSSDFMNCVNSPEIGQVKFDEK